MSSVTSINFDDCQIRLVERENGQFWYVVADVCRCVGVAINSRTGKPNVTVGTRELGDDHKEKYRVDTPENPKNPWIDMMIVSPEGLIHMLSLSDSLKAQEFRQFIQHQPQHSNSHNLPYAAAAE